MNTEVWQWVYKCPTCRKELRGDQVDVLENVGPMHECRPKKFEPVELIGYHRVEPIVTTRTGHPDRKGAA